VDVDAHQVDDEADLALVPLEGDTGEQLWRAFDARELAPEVILVLRERDLGTGSVGDHHRVQERRITPGPHRLALRQRHPRAQLVVPE